MAKYLISDGESGLTVRNGLNNNADELYAAKLDVGVSEIYPDANAKKVYQEIVGPSTNDKPIEFLNIGYTGHGGTDEIHENNTGIVRINGRINFIRNMEWDQANVKWLTPLQGATAYGSVCLEMGGEAVILHATPAGVNFSDVPHEILMAKANGTDGQAGHFLSSGYYTQSKGTIYARFNSTTYDAAATNNCWNQTSGVQPLLQLSTGEAKNTINELARFEANSNSSGAYAGVYFRKSGGTLVSQTIVTTAHITGRMGWRAYSGAGGDHTTAAIDAITEGTMANNQVGQSLEFKTSPDTTANLAIRFKISKDGNLGFFGVTPAARQVVPTGSTADQIITALQNLGLFAQS